MENGKAKKKIIRNEKKKRKQREPREYEESREETVI